MNNVRLQIITNWLSECLVQTEGPLSLGMHLVPSSDLSDPSENMKCSLSFCSLLDHYVLSPDKSSQITFSNVLQVSSHFEIPNVMSSTLDSAFNDVRVRNLLRSELGSDYLCSTSWVDDHLIDYGPSTFVSIGSFPATFYRYYLAGDFCLYSFIITRPLIYTLIYWSLLAFGH